MKIYFYRALIATLIFGYCSAEAQTIFVNRAATGANNGSSWANAYQKLDDALKAATAPGRQIWVAAGVYRPDSLFGFSVNPGTQLYGGFAGTETAIGQRNVQTNATTLSGDLGANDVPFNFASNRADNAFHVLWLRGTDTISRAVVDGFTVRSGNTKTATTALDPERRGGGMLVQTKVTVRNCLFTDNAGVSGAAIAAPVAGASAILLDNCVFERNLSPERAIVHCLNLRSGEVNRCVFRQNSTQRGTLYPQACRNFTIDSCSVERNRNTSTTVAGAGIFVVGGTVRITNSAMSRNRSVNGGGLLVNGNEEPNTLLQLNNCLIELDTAPNGGGVSTGGAARIQMERCTLRNNTSTERGNALYIADRTQISVKNSLIEKNRGANTIWTSDSLTTAVFESCDIKENSGVPTDDSGVFLCGFVSSLTVKKCNIEANEGATGGVIFVQNARSKAIFEDTKLIGNMAGNDGGVAFVGFEGALTLTKCTMTGNVAEDDGGVVFTQNAGSNVLLEDCTAKDNISGSSGGIVFNGFEAQVVVKRCTLENNEGNTGGVLTSQNENTLSTLEDCVMRANRSAESSNAGGSGGALFIGFNSAAIIKKCVFENNNAEGLAGAVGLQNDSTKVTIQDCLFLGNESSSGGAVYAFPGGDINISGSTFESNKADFGGALNIDSDADDITEIKVDRCSFVKNSAATQAGALNINNVPNFFVINSLFSENVSDNGGAITNNSSDRDTSRLHLLYCTIAKNTGVRAGGIVQYEEKADTSKALLRLTNTIFAKQAEGPNYAVELGKPTVISAGGNLSDDGSMTALLKGTNDLNATDPKFIDVMGGDFHLQPSSPCVNKGVIVAGGPAVDLEGMPRDAMPDMGAFEYRSTGVFTTPTALRIELRPNPTVDQATLRIDDAVKGAALIEGFNVAGARVYSLNTEKIAGDWRQNISVADWPAGLYSFRVLVGERVYAGQLVKE
jgi:hypothetical protein